MRRRTTSSLREPWSLPGPPNSARRAAQLSLMTRVSAIVVTLVTVVGSTPRRWLPQWRRPAPFPAAPLHVSNLLLTCTRVTQWANAYLSCGLEAMASTLFGLAGHCIGQNNLRDDMHAPPSTGQLAPADLFGGDLPPTREVKVDFDVGGGGEPSQPGCFQTEGQARCTPCNKDSPPARRMGQPACRRWFKCAATLAPLLSCPLCRHLPRHRCGGIHCRGVLHHVPSDAGCAAAAAAATARAPPLDAPWIQSAALPHLSLHTAVHSPRAPASVSPAASHHN